MKTVKNWFKGILLAFLGGIVFFYSVIAPVELFVKMMNTTGKDFVGYFIYFAVYLLFFIFAPIIYFYTLQDKTKENKDKE